MRRFLPARPNSPSFALLAACRGSATRAGCACPVLQRGFRGAECGMAAVCAERALGGPLLSADRAARRGWARAGRVAARTSRIWRETCSSASRRGVWGGTRSVSSLQCSHVPCWCYAGAPRSARERAQGPWPAYGQPRRAEGRHAHALDGLVAGALTDASSALSSWPQRIGLEAVLALVAHAEGHVDRLRGKTILHGVSEQGEGLADEVGVLEWREHDLRHARCSSSGTFARGLSPRPRPRPDGRGGLARR